MKNLFLLIFLLLINLEASKTIDTSKKAITITNAISLKKAQIAALKLSKYDIYIYKTISTKKSYFILYAVNIPKIDLQNTLRDIHINFNSAYLSSNKRIKILASNNFNKNIFIQSIKTKFKAVKSKIKKPIVKKQIIKKKIIKKQVIKKKKVVDKESWQYILRGLKTNKVLKPNKILLQAKREFYNKNYHKAIIFFTDFLNNHYSNIEANFLLGRSYYLSKQYTLALQTYQNLLIINDSLENVKLAIKETKLAINQNR